MSTVRVMIETPGGSSRKYDYDPKEHLFGLSKILPWGMVFPYDFGHRRDMREAVREGRQKK